MAVLTLVDDPRLQPDFVLAVMAALALYAILRFALYRSLRQRQEEVIEAPRRSRPSFIETARAMQSIKIFGRESDREARWQNRYAESSAAVSASGRFTIGFKTANELIYGLENVLVVYLGAARHLRGDMTVGMLYAFMAYKEQFLEQGHQPDRDRHPVPDAGPPSRPPLRYRADRAGDRLWPGGMVERPIEGAIELRDVTLPLCRDGARDAVRRRISKIEPGEFVAITGPSGGGKTTLLKIMLGLFKPKTGSVLIDSVPLDHFGTQAFRAQVGVVMQDDHLLSGSLAENICSSTRSLDLEWIRECARHGRHRRRDHGHADELQHPDRRHGNDTLRRPAPAACCSPARSTAVRASCSWTRAPRISTSTRSGR